MDYKKFSSRYTKIKYIAGGTYGKVYKCLDKKYDQLQAIKIFKSKKQKEIPGSKEVKNICCLIKRGYIFMPKCFKIKVVEINKRSTYCIISELAKCSLLECMEKNNTPYSRYSLFKVYIKKIIRCLKSLERLGYIHGDLKPENILVMEDSSITLTDWGDMLKIGSNENPGGTVYYRHPFTLSTINKKRVVNLIRLNSISEQAACFKAKIQWDIWSLGCIIYEIITGDIFFDPKEDVSPYREDGGSKHHITIFEMIDDLKKVINSNINTSLKFISPEKEIDSLCSFIHKTIEIDYEKSFSSYDELLSHEFMSF